MSLLHCALSALLMVAACSGTVGPDDPDLSPAGDMSTAAKAFGAVCAADGECESGMCRPFAMMTIMRCTKACTTATQAADCPSPSAATCTTNGYCRFNM